MYLEDIYRKHGITRKAEFEEFAATKYPQTFHRKRLTGVVDIDDSAVEGIVKAFEAAPRTKITAEEIIEQYELKDRKGFLEYSASKFPDEVDYRLTASSTTILASSVEKIVKTYLQDNAQNEMVAEDEARIAELARSMPITSGANFEGYRITRYGGYVSGDEVATIPMGFFTGSMSNDAVNETIKRVRNIAIQELKEAAANIDCNAVIGLDFDYITIDRTGTQGTLEVKVVLTANGTAVEIEPL